MSHHPASITVNSTFAPHLVADGVAWELPDIDFRAEVATDWEGNNWHVETIWVRAYRWEDARKVVSDFVRLPSTHALYAEIEATAERDTPDEISRGLMDGRLGRAGRNATARDRAKEEV